MHFSPTDGYVWDGRLIFKLGVRSMQINAYLDFI